MDPPIAPGRVLSCQTKDQRDRARGNSWTSRPSVRVSPLSSHQLSMPAQQGLRLDKEASSTSSRQKPAQSSEHCSICWLQGRTRRLSAQNGYLVTEHDDLNSQLLLASARQADQLEEADEGYVEEGECHAPSLSTESCSRRPRSAGPDGVFGATLHLRRQDHANESPGRRSGLRFRHPQALFVVRSLWDGYGRTARWEANSGASEREG
ncbi:MAG: hypothetical protein IVW55_18410 [Chloroflexi bacterium]|nr:hypothetical protein [Chloroflexota bacterium]